MKWFKFRKNKNQNEEENIQNDRITNKHRENV